MKSGVLRTSERLRVEVCGGIGVGKSTLAARLASHLKTAELVSERFRENPIWGPFYEAPAVHVREKNISFLAQHFSEIKHARSNLVICDFAPVQDLAYASLVGEPEHLHVMSSVYHHLRRFIPSPTLLIHIVAPVEKQLVQIALRGRAEEAVLSAQTLAALDSALTTYLRVADAPVLTIDAGNIDLRSDSTILKTVTDRIFSQTASVT